MIKIQNPLIARFARGLGANGITQLSQLFIRLAEIPLFLSYWGANGYGEWLMVMALPSALILSDGGITKTTQREMIMRTSRGDEKSALAVFQSSWCALLIISPLILLIVITMMIYSPIHDWLKLETVSRTDLVFVITLLTTQVLFNFQSSLLRGIFASRGEYATGELLHNLLSILSFCGMTIAVLSGNGMFEASAGLAVGSVAGYLLMWNMAYKRESVFRYGLEYSSLTEIKNLALPSIANLTFPLSDAINIQGVRILIGLMLGPASLASFSSLRTLCRLALQPVLSIARTLEPEIAIAYGAGKDQEVRTLLLRGSQVTVWVSILLCIILLFIGELLYENWTNHQINLDWFNFLLLLSASFLSSFWSVALMIPCATNRHMRLSFIYLLTQGIGSIIFTFFATQAFATNGPAIALFIIETLTCITVLRAASLLANQPIALWLKSAISLPLKRFSSTT